MNIRHLCGAGGFPSLHISSLSLPLLRSLDAGTDKQEMQSVLCSWKAFLRCWVQDMVPQMALVSHGGPGTGWIGQREASQALLASKSRGDLSSGPSPCVLSQTLFHSTLGLDFQAVPPVSLSLLWSGCSCTFTELQSGLGWNGAHR